MLSCMGGWVGGNETEQSSASAGLKLDKLGKNIDICIHWQNMKATFIQSTSFSWDFPDKFPVTKIFSLPFPDLFSDSHRQS